MSPVLKTEASLRWLALLTRPLLVFFSNYMHTHVNYVHDCHMIAM